MNPRITRPAPAPVSTPLALSLVGAEWLDRFGATLQAVGLGASELARGLKTGRFGRTSFAPAGPPGRTSIRLARRSAPRAAGSVDGIAPSMPDRAARLALREGCPA